jgi:zinc transport system substrate-binding protein
MWTASNSGPESDDDHDEDGHDEDGHDEEELNLDPHSWLSPLAFKQQVSNVLDILVEKYPDMESKFTDNANAYMAKLDSLHSDFEMTFSNSSTCESNTVVANHNAYNYIGVKYNIEFVTVHGLDPEGEPSAQDVAEVVEEIKENDIKVLFIEEYTDPTAVDGIVQETGVTLQYLYTMELPPSDSDDDYLSLMNKNLNNLKSGLACTN